eukprot:COSAG06_NODE_14046_length_1194_cov_1.995434_1_plen_118_part_00
MTEDCPSTYSARHPGLAQYVTFKRGNSRDRVALWLVRIECGSAVEAFHQHDIDGHVLVALDEAQLKSEVGIESFGLRTKVLLERANASAVPSGSQSDGELTLQLEPVDESDGRSGEW